MNLLRRQPLHRQLLLAAGALLVPLLVLIVFSARRTWTERQDEVRESTVSFAVTASAYLDEFLRRLEALAAGLVHHPAVVALETPQADALFREILRDQPLLTNIGLIDETGIVRGSALKVDGRRIGGPALAALVASGRPQIGGFVIGPVTGKPIVTLAYPVRDAAARVVGALTFAIDLTELQTTFADIPLPAGSVVSVVDRAGTVMARTREAEKYLGHTVTPIGLAALPRVERRVDMDGIERFTADAAVKGAPWVVSVGIPASVVGTSLFPLQQRNIAIALMALVGALVLVLWIARRVSRHLDLLRTTVQRMAAGDLSPPEHEEGPSRELSDLQQAFVIMAANLRTAHGALDHQVEQERKMNETLHLLQRQVVRQERLAAVGLLASGIAHEINNPLQAILGAAELVERAGGSLEDEARRQLAGIKTQGIRAREIIRSLARFSSQQSAPWTLISLGEVVDEVLRLSNSGGETSSTRVDVDVNSARRVYGNVAELTQVALNFVINAQHAIQSASRDDGRISIRVRDVGCNVRLEVQDNGPGVCEADEPKLFQPFFTTKPVGQGTGLGLSFSYGIIRAYGGAISHSRGLGGGAIFFFELPAAESEGRTAQRRFGA